MGGGDVQPSVRLVSYGKSKQGGAVNRDIVGASCLKLPGLGKSQWGKACRLQFADSGQNAVIGGRCLSDKGKQMLGIFR